MCDRAMDKRKCLQAYSDEYYRLMFGIHPEMDAETSLKKAMVFLDHYAMDDDVYKRLCCPVMNKVFSLPMNCHNEEITGVFHDGFQQFAYNSSPMLWSEKFELIRSIAVSFGDNSLFVVEDEGCEEDPDVAFKFMFPIHLTWEEISDGGFISDVLFNMFHNDYYLFGNSGNWGIWCNYDNPREDIEILGYNNINKEIQVYRNWCISNQQ